MDEKLAEFIASTLVFGVFGVVPYITVHLLAPEQMHLLAVAYGTLWISLSISVAKKERHQ